MSDRLKVIVFDRDERQLATRMDRIQAECATRADRGRFEIIDTQRRYQVLNEAGASASSVALIDLRDDDRDMLAHGFAIIETVRRHALLSRRCRPIAWTAWSSHLTADWARRSGAYALLDDDLVFRGGAAILDVVARVAQQIPVHFSKEVRFEHHTLSRASRLEEETLRQERQERVLGEAYRKGDEEVLPRLARGEGFRAIHQAVPGSKLEDIRKRVNALRKAARTVALTPYRGTDSLQALEAQGQPPRAPAPTPLTDRPDTLAAVRWWFDEDIRRWAYHGDDEVAALTEYVRHAPDAVRQQERARQQTRAQGRPTEMRDIRRETELTNRVAERLAASLRRPVGFDEANSILYRGLHNLEAAAIEMSERRGRRV